MKKREAMRARPFLLMAAFGLFVASMAVACSDDVPSDQTSTTGTPSGSTGSGMSTGTGGGVGTGGAGGGTPDCYTNPKTHNEIINACTDAEKVDKKPDLPLLGPDGKLPPLP